VLIVVDVVIVTIVEKVDVHTEVIGAPLELK
jgi:hypothetical protein